jgi:hypothetical protein
MRKWFYSVWLSRALNITVGLPLVVLVWVGTSVTVGQSLPADAQPTCTVPSAMFASWFDAGHPSLNGSVKPADSVAFSNPQQNCAFYQWSEQMFLWLTSPAPKSYGGGGGRIFDSPAFYDVSPPDSTGQRTLIPHEPGKIRFAEARVAKVGPHRLPVIMDKRGRMFEIEPQKLAPSGKALILNTAGKPIEIERLTLEKGKPVFLDKAGKAIAKPKAIIRPELNKDKALIAQKFMIGQKPVFLDSLGNVIDTEEGQAGGSGVLQAQNGSLVYYVVMVNDVYAYFLTGARNNGITPSTQFPTTQTDLVNIEQYASMHGKTSFPDPNALAIEVKSSWVEATSLQNPGSYITMQATIPTYNTSSSVLWTPNGQKTVQLALVGMHVVGSAKGHPEMIWATFEHFGNTPNADYQYNRTSGTNPKTVPESTSGTWLFAASNSAGPFNQMHMDGSSPPNIKADHPPGSTNIPPPFTISPSDTIRKKAFGGGFDFKPNPLDASTAASNTEVIAINNSVLGQLVSGDIRANYYMIGSTWTIGGAAPSVAPFKNGVGNQVGTSQLANTTMETYQQGPSKKWNAGVNCFFCHTSNTTNVSHIFPSIQPLFPP